MGRFSRRLGLGIPAAVLAVFGLRLVLFPEGMSPPPAAALEDLRVAPNPIPPGTSELIVGSARGLPEELELLALGGGLAVESVRALSRNALRAVVSASPETREATLRLRVGERALDLKIAVGRASEPLALPANLPREALETGRLETVRDILAYGFLPAEGVRLASLSILNETTGGWFQRDLEPERARDPSEPPRVDFLGVRLAPGENRLLVASISEDGTSRLEELVVVRREPDRSEG